MTDDEGNVKNHYSATEFFLEHGSGDTKIKKCGRLFRFQCPKEWRELIPTDQKRVRFCPKCKHNVYLCYSEEELQNHKGECAALFQMYFVVGGVR
jgi:hypothetical protein